MQFVSLVCCCRTRFDAFSLSMASHSQETVRRRNKHSSRRLLFKKLDYLQWICALAVFLFFVILFQILLPTSGDSWYSDQDIKFKPTKLLESSSTLASFSYGKPQLALVFADLSADPQQLLMVTVAAALLEIGYAIQVYSLGDGPARDIWRKMGVTVTIIPTSDKFEITVDWLSYDGILVNSPESKDVFSCFMQEPFKALPLIWTIHERTLALRSREYTSSGQIDLINDWKKVFKRATCVVFSSYVLPIIYSVFDAGNYFVIPGSPAEAWEADSIMSSYENNLHVKMGYRLDDFVIAIVHTEFSHTGLWLDHALLLQALLPVSTDFSSYSSNLKVIVLSGDSTNNYSVAVEAITHKLGYPKGSVKHIGYDGNADSVLIIADLVIYGSFHEEQFFPDILKKAMCFEKPIVAPNISIIRKYVEDRVNGYLFPQENLRVLTQITSQVISNGKLSPLARNIASNGRRIAKNLMVLETVEGYASLLENVLKLPSEVSVPKAVMEIPPKLKQEWQWHLFEAFLNLPYPDSSSRSLKFLNKVEDHWNQTQRKTFYSVTAIDDSFSYDIWEEGKDVEIANARKWREEEELKDRTNQPRRTWEEVYRNAKRADRSKNNLHQRDEGDLERTGQLLCIYEPYFGKGTWPFLHTTSLYRGIGLSTNGRRNGTDDIDATARLPLLHNSYYRDVLIEYGAFFAIANRIDRVHRNAWIGFQSWRATAGKASLSRISENALLDAIQTQRHGDTLYFWARMDMDPRNPLQQDFWSFCDSINAGNCRSAFSDTLKMMYNLNLDLDFIPPMPMDGDTWSVKHSWALPTRSFLEFVMFSRMFVNSLDAQMYNEHHKDGRCCLSLFKDKHCYSRLLELLINVWAYHSVRQMVYVNPETGIMQEHHCLQNRTGQMWIKWFSGTTLKSMDEDLAEESDSEHPSRRWLWPSTGEVFWQGLYEREKKQRQQQKEMRRHRIKNKQNRMKKRARQKVLGKYVKPPPE